MFRLRMRVRGKKLKLIIVSSFIIKNCALLPYDLNYVASNIKFHNHKVCS